MRSGFKELYQKVIEVPGGCAGCGLCVLVCPHGQLVLAEGRPRHVSAMGLCPWEEGGKCGLCAHVCPRLGPTPGAEPARDAPWGAYRRMVVARTRDPAIVSVCQDGGLVGTILKWGLMHAGWPAAVSWARDEVWHPVCTVVTDPDQVTWTCGSKYTYAPVADGLRQVWELRLAGSPFGLVGLPCHVAGVRRLQAERSRYTRGLALCVGLFCSESFSYEWLLRGVLAEQHGVPLTEVRKMDIKKGTFVLHMNSGAEHRFPLRSLKAYRHPGCGRCRDFASEMADISAGGLGIGGWTVALIRTETGEAVMRELEVRGLVEVREITEFPGVVDALRKACLRKQGIG